MKGTSSGHQGDMPHWNIEIYIFLGCLTWLPETVFLDRITKVVAITLILKIIVVALTTAVYEWSAHLSNSVVIVAQHVRKTGTDLLGELADTWRGIFKINRGCPFHFISWTIIIFRQLPKQFIPMSLVWPWCLSNMFYIYLHMWKLMQCFDAN